MPVTDWPYSGLPDTPYFRRLADDPRYRAIFDARYRDGLPFNARPARSSSPCIHLGPPLPNQANVACACRLRECSIYGVCSTGRSPAPMWCANCPDYEAD
jgi:hypothetical protein